MVERMVAQRVDQCVMVGDSRGVFGLVLYATGSVELDIQVLLEPDRTLNVPGKAVFETISAIRPIKPKRWKFMGVLSKQS
jgi:hypothetical protein